MYSGRVQRTNAPRFSPYRCEVPPDRGRIISLQLSDSGFYIPKSAIRIPQLQPDLLVV